MKQTFKTQLEACLPDLWRFAWSLTHDRDAADDLVQDCIERALRKRLLWVPGRPVKPWLAKILMNIFRDSWRKQSRYRSVSLNEATDIIANTSSAEDLAELNAVWKSLTALPDEQREALLAVVIGGLSYKEAAGALGVPPGTVMSRIARARARIRAETEGATEGAEGTAGTTGGAGVIEIRSVK